MVADEVGVLQLQVEGDVAGQRLCVPYDATVPSACLDAQACSMQPEALLHSSKGPLP